MTTVIDVLDRLRDGRGFDAVSWRHTPAGQGEVKNVIFTLTRGGSGDFTEALVLRSELDTLNVATAADRVTARWNRATVRRAVQHPLETPIPDDALFHDCSIAAPEDADSVPWPKMPPHWQEKYDTGDAEDREEVMRWQRLRDARIRLQKLEEQVAELAKRTASPRFTVEVRDAHGNPVDGRVTITELR